MMREGEVTVAEHEVDAPRPEHSQEADPREQTSERLLALLESAEKGSRTLDAEVHWLCCQPRYASISPELEAEAYVRHAKLDYDLAGTVIPHDEYIKYPTAPPFTTSLDGALMLVPEGWILDHLGDDAAGAVGQMKFLRATAELTNGGGKRDGGLVQGQGATRPLALCLAALRARQAKP